MSEEPCAAVSATCGESCLGTASAATAWLLLEHPGPWPRNPFAATGPLGEAGPRLVEQTRAWGVQPVLIRRHGRQRRPHGHWCVLVRSGARPPWGEQRRLASPEEVLHADLAALADGRSPRFGDPLTGPLLLVCTHGKRDACCARYGRPAAAALALSHPDATWECTHVGGDRFAANLVCLPHGLYFGRVGENDVSAVAASYAAGHVDLDCYRGRAGQPAATQAAEWYARRYEGLTGVDDLLPVGETTLDGATVAVELLSDANCYRVVVERETSGTLRPRGCGDASRFQPLAWQLRCLDRTSRPPAPVAREGLDGPEGHIRVEPGHDDN